MRTLVSLTALSLAACGAEPDPNGPILHTQTSLRAATGKSDVEIVGVTVDPDTKKRYVLDANGSLYELTSSGARLAARLDQMPVDRPVQSAYTDIAAIGDGQFAVTAMNDGFRLDLSRSSFKGYFCYLPGELEDSWDGPLVQLTNAVTYDVEGQMIYAQPQTFERNIEGDVVLSQIGQFTLAGGEGFAWRNIEDLDFSAGGMWKTPTSIMLLGRKSKIHRYDLDRAEMVDAIDLKDLGVERIEGLTRDPETGRMLVVDGASDELLEIELRD